jgi:uncharacterized protein with ParB-like and HNH nuclease domain
MDKFETNLKTIATLLYKNENVEFIIPTYQRPYVWEYTELKKFLEDIMLSASEIDNRYFIGNVYVTKNESTHPSYDIIDGQQRFTTLWLIAFVFRQVGVPTELISFLRFESTLRLNFTIRKEVKQYLTYLLSKTDVTTSDQVDVSSEFLVNIAAGIETITGILKGKSSDELIMLGDFIYHNVEFVYNIAPKETDLNHLFTALGNTGLQLEQTDILKSLLLKKVANKVLYSKIWEACENMEDYFEKNVSDRFANVTLANTKNEAFRYFSEDLDITVKESKDLGDKDEPAKSIFDIINSGDYKEIAGQTIKNSSSKCRSIIPFSILLLHTYRIYNKGKEDFTTELDKKNLLHIFINLTKHEQDESEIIRFFQLLWEIRYLFDKHIVKWRFDNEGDTYVDKDEKLRLTSISQENARKNRAHSEESMLQSVLYFNGGYNQQYWLTPYLAYLQEHQNLDSADTLQELEKIDNLMLPGMRKNISWQLMDAEERNKAVPNVEQYLQEDQGVKFNHYWFYKIEYLLWKGWDKNDAIFKKYRITSKNSVEHVSPQKPEFSKVRFGNADSIGNLGLLSVGQNSSYKNYDTRKKRIDFINKAELSTYESLKLKIIYYSFTDNEDWNSEKVEAHKQDMIALVSQHYNQNKPETIAILEV